MRHLLPAPGGGGRALGGGTPRRAPGRAGRGRSRPPLADRGAHGDRPRKPRGRCRQFQTRRRGTQRLLSLPVKLALRLDCENGPHTELSVRCVCKIGQFEDDTYLVS